MSKRKWHVKQKKKITLVFFCIFDQMFRKNGHNCYYNECQNLIFGRHPILAISGLFVFSYRTFDYYSNNPHTTVNSMTAVGAKYPLYFKYINDIDMYCHCLPSYHIYASFENFFKITTTVKRLLRRWVGGV